MADENSVLTVAVGLGLLSAGTVLVRALDNWLQNKAGRRFFSQGVLCAMAFASAFWWAGQWWLGELPQNPAPGYGLIAGATLLVLGLLWRNFSGLDRGWKWAACASALQLIIAYQAGLALAFVAAIVAVAWFALMLLPTGGEGEVDDDMAAIAGHLEEQRRGRAPSSI